MSHLQISPARATRPSDAAKIAGAALIGAGLSLLAAIALHFSDLPDGPESGSPSQDAATALHLQSLGKWG